MIEYLNSAIRATKGEDTTVEAFIKDNSGNILQGIFHLRIYDKDRFIGIYNGALQEDGAYKFIIPAKVTSGLSGRYFYCICDNANKTYCFKQPIYFI